MAAAVTQHDGNADTPIPSSLTRGLLITDHSHGRRGLVVEGCTGTGGVDRIDSAVDAAQTWAASNAHADVTNLPAASHLSGFRMISDSIAFGSVDYHRIPGLTVPKVAAWKLAESSHGTVSLNYFQNPNTRDANGRPSGSLTRISTKGGIVSSQPYSWPVDVEHIRVPIVGLATDPRIATNQYRSCVNDAAIWMSDLFDNDNAGAGTDGAGDREFPAYTLWYCGAFIRRVFDSQGTPKYAGEHVFGHISSPGWIEQSFYQTGDSVTAKYVYSIVSFAPIIVFNMIVARDLLPFTGVFPVHNAP